MKKHNLTAVALSTCTVLAASMGSAQAGPSIDQSPFAMQTLSSGYMVADNHEGKCGEGKCGGTKTTGAKTEEGKCGEGKCGGAKATEGKCGEGKCGMSKMDSSGDGAVTKDEFMSAHESIFAKKDMNGDGVLDAAEMKKMEGKCGEGKCGGEKKGASEGKCGEGKCGGKQ